MSTIITQSAHDAYANRDAAARKRADRLAQASNDQMQAALAYLSVIDPEAFEIAFFAVPPADPESEDDDQPVSLCATCGAPVGIFPEQALNWRHFRGDPTASAPHHTFDPGHAPEPAWYLLDEAAEEF